MKKTHLFVCWLWLSATSIYAQNTIVTNAPFAPGANGMNSAAFWSRRGNTNGTGTNNVFGTLYNASVYHYTNNTYKMKLNGDYTYSINGFNAPRNGYLLIGQEQPVGGGIPPGYLQTKGAFTRLHLHDNSSIGGPFYDVESGYRPWMRNGIYFSGFSDAGYLGQKANAFDNTDMIFTWSDNNGTDNMSFAFTRGDGLSPNNTNQTSGDLNGQGINGREIMRFASSGNIGMGPRFDAFNAPTNDLHIRSENLTSSFIQIDNQELAVNGPTSTSFFNGAIFGILGNANATMNGNVLLYNQENRHILIGTNFGINPGFNTPSNANEKVRITSVGAPTDLPLGGYGVYNPYGRALTSTYVAISGDPANPIKRPTSLLQIGDEADPSSGIRDWMYTGTMVTRQTDNMFIGMKNEGLNHNDAIISWGDDDIVGAPGIGPDNLRFIFTETTIFGPHPPATDNNGVEVGRFTPSCATCPVDKPSFGIGNFSPGSIQPYGNPAYVGATLDVDGDARIRTVTNDNTLTQILVRDNSDYGRIKYRNLNSIVNGNNGVYYNASTGAVQLGASCTSPTVVADLAATAFTSSRAVDLAGNSFIMTNGRVGFNIPPCTLPGNVVEISAPINQSGLRFRQLTSASPSLGGANTVLSVNANGDVIVVDNSAANNGIYNNNGFAQLGVDCTNPNFAIEYANNGLTTNRAVSLNNRELVFGGGGTGGRIGIGMAPCTPVNNRLEITGLGPNQSGLRFTNLTYGSPSISPPLGTPKYLSVSVTGDVVLMDGAGAAANNGTSLSAGNVQLGQDVNAPGNPGQLLNNREIPMNNFNIAFSKPFATVPYNTNSVVIGTTNPLIAPQARLEVIRDFSTPDPLNGTPTGLRVQNNDVSTGTANTGIAQGIYSIMDADNKGNYGGYFIAQSPNVNNASNNGVFGMGQFGANNVGVYGAANGAPTSTLNQAGIFVALGNPGSTSMGVSGSNFGGDRSYGGLFNAGGGTLFNYGVYAEVNPVGPNDYALFVNGNATLIGGIATGFGSDSLIKTNIQPVTNATALLGQINPKTFDYRVNDFPSLNLDADNHYGVIAQNVEIALPSLVTTVMVPEVLDSNNNVLYAAQSIKTVKYQEFIPILIAGFNEQQERINAQDSTIAAMQQQMDDMMAMITNCCSQGNSLNAPNNNGNNGTNDQNNFTYQPVHTTEVRLTDTYCVLGENSPNPFRDHTVINYNLSETIQSAQIVFYNAVGQVIKVLEINDRGEGRLNVYGEDLRSGMYTYSLIIDGNVCETKKMIKE